MLHLIKKEICFVYIIKAAGHCTRAQEHMMTSLSAILFLRASSSPDLSFVSSVTYIRISCADEGIHFVLMQKCNVLEKVLIGQVFMFSITN